MPQYLGRIGEVGMFQAAAVACGASFIEIALPDSKEESIARF
jgi:hypothetical protein